MNYKYVDFGGKMINSKNKKYMLTLFIVFLVVLNIFQLNK